MTILDDEATPTAETDAAHKRVRSAVDLLADPPLDVATSNTASRATTTTATTATATATTTTTATATTTTEDAAAAAKVPNQRRANADDRVAAAAASSGENLPDFAGIAGPMLEAAALVWIHRLEMAKNRGRWSEMKTRSVILASLTGRARRWHLVHGVHIAAYDEWKKAFLRAFSVPRSLMATTGVGLRTLARLPPIDIPVREYIWRSAAVAAQRGASASHFKNSLLKDLSQYFDFLPTEQLKAQTHESVSQLSVAIEDAIMANGTSTWN